jgi:hypothetical protein
MTWLRHHFRSGRLVSALLCVLLWPAWVAWATGDSGYEIVGPPAVRLGGALPAPAGPVVLTVRGATRGDPLHFDRAGLERLGLIRYASKNRWYDRRTTYEGVLGSALLDAVGVPAGAVALRMTALNDYVVLVPLADLRRWPVMFALKLDGEYLSVRDKGPIWLVYPNHLEPELGGPRYQGRWIWQLREIGFE